MKKIMMMTVVISIVMLSVSFAASEPPQVPTNGMVTMADIGAKTCIPCKMMAPILEELEKEYKGKASIVFIDVKENPSEAPKYGIRGIPTQIFYDKDGKEVYRHLGFLDKKSIVAQLEKLGVK
jgi:thioredoxin 1